MKKPCIYILANKKYGTLYTGVKSSLERRTFQHKESSSGFASKYECSLVVYYESYETMEHANTREKQIKAGSRKKKLGLIDSFNPEWKDSSQSFL